MQQQIDQVKARVAECIAKGEALFGVKMPHVQIRFDLRGRCAGVAGRRAGLLYVKFNREHLVLGGKTWLHLLNDTVPHEIALKC